jgi:hypothetical protein
MGKAVLGRLIVDFKSKGTNLDSPKCWNVFIIGSGVENVYSPGAVEKSGAMAFLD